jgi:hypothetical protein
MTARMWIPVFSAQGRGFVDRYPRAFISTQ